MASGFTVESDSPYRSIRPGEENGTSTGEDVATTLQTTGFTLNSDNGTEPDSVTQRIISSLENSGINQPGAGRYKVENLVTSDVRDVTHTGVLIAPDGGRHNAFFYIGREDEVISNVQTRNAATAIRAVEPECNHLVMVGFGRDGNAQTVARYLGSLTVLQVAANKDLQLPWLKEEASDNAFIIVSEPEVKLHRQDNGQVCLEVVGINAFNPARGDRRAQISPYHHGNHGGYLVRHRIVPRQVDQRQRGQSKPAHPEKTCWPHSAGTLTVRSGTRC